MNELTAFQRDCLRAVSILDRPCGLDLKEWLEDDRGGQIHHGRLYPNLDTLAEKGLIHKEQADRRTNAYTLTRRGKREVEMFRDAWTEAAPDPQDGDAGLDQLFPESEADD